jgi:lauroyl/myristoyl acyltransferase
MGMLTALRFKLMFAWVAFLRRFVSYATGNNIAAWTVHWLHPAVIRQKTAYIAGLNKTLGNQQTTLSAWRRHKALVGVTRLQGSYYSQDDISWINQCDVDIDGAEHIHAAHQGGKGVLTMTYHHHFNMLFCNLMGRLNLPITTIAMDARDNERYRKFGDRVDRIYAHAEKLLNGGDIILVKPNSPVRPILRAFENNHLVITANDFPEVFDDKNRRDFSFLGTQLSCPTGTVKLAVKKQIPMVAGYLDWLGSNRFRLVIRPVSDGSVDMKIKTAMANYLAILEDMVQKQPGLWEGWKWLSENGIKG